MSDVKLKTARAPNRATTSDNQSPPAGDDVMTNDDRLAQLKAWYRQSRDHYSQWYTEAQECYDFVAGRQWAEEDLSKLKNQNRPVITFNRLASVVESVAGFEVSNRQEVRFIPRQVGASGVNELLTDAGKWCRDECHAEDEESDAFVDLITCGVGCTESRIDYTENPDGKFVLERVDPLEMKSDATSKARNFADARHHFRVRRVDAKAAQAMFPGWDLADIDAVWARDVEDDSPQPHNRTEAQFYRNDQAPNIDKNEGKVTLVEAQWFELQDNYRVADPINGNIVTLTKPEFAQLDQRARELNIGLIAAPMKVKKYYRAMLGAEILKMWDGPAQGGFSWKFMTGKRDRNKACWYGLVRGMLDPQRWANKWLSQTLHIINSNAKGGIFAEADAFENPQQAMEEYSSTDAITFVTQGALSGDKPKIKDKGIAQFPSGIDQLMQFAIASIRDVSGVNIELLGMANRDQPGILEHQRKQAGLTILAGLFDSLKQYRKEHGRLLLYYITNFLADGRLIRVGGEENARYVPLVHTPGLVEYDVIVDDMPTSPNSKEQTWFALTQLMPFLAKMNLPPPVMLQMLKYSPLPSSFTADITKALASVQAQPPPPDPKMVEAQSKVQVANIQAQTEQMRSQAEAMTERARALGQVAQARAESDKAAAEVQSTNAQAFATTAAGIKSLADAQVELQGPRFDALQMLMDALQAEHDRQQGVQQQAFENTIALQQHHADLAQQAAQGTTDQSQAEADLAQTQAKTDAIENPPAPSGG